MPHWPAADTNFRRATLRPPHTRWRTSTRPRLNRASGDWDGARRKQKENQSGGGGGGSGSALCPVNDVHQALCASACNEVNM